MQTSMNNFCDKIIAGQEMFRITLQANVLSLIKLRWRILKKMNNFKLGTLFVSVKPEVCRLM